MRGIKSFLFRPISRIKALRDDEAGVRAFTLVELLVVVLIIGILSAIAIPMYESAVDKSRWSTLLTPAKALQTAQAAAYLETGEYADDASALIVSLPGEAQDNKYVMPDAQYSINTKSANQSTITGELNALPNVRLSMFLKNPDNYLFCDAKTGDARAERLCEKLLGGTKAYTKDGYTQYLLDYPGTCAWSNTTGQCYTSEEARCTAMGMPYAGGICGYTSEWDVSSTTQINEGGVCISTQGGCRNVQVNEGGVCKAGGYNGCRNAKIYDGGICEATYPSWGCVNTTINKGGVCIGVYSGNCVGITVDGGKCIAKGQGACGNNAGTPSTYINGGCCEEGVPGQTNCPDYAPKC